MQASRALIRLALPKTVARSTLAINNIAPVRYTPQRNMNFITDALSKVASKTVEGSKGKSLFSHPHLPNKLCFINPLEKQFTKMMDTMVAYPKWTFRPWKEVMEDQLKSWLLYIPGMSNSKDIEELKGLKGKVTVFHSPARKNMNLTFTSSFRNVGGHDRKRIRQSFFN